MLAKTFVPPRGFKSGVCGAAWEVDVEAFRRTLGNTADDDALLTSWIMEVPEAHPVWNSYLIFMLHLRPLPGRAEAIIHLTGATHEMELWAIDPDAKRGAIILGETNPWPWVLHPGNFAAQLVAADDTAAIATLEDAVAAVVAGRLNPDTDFIRQWAERYGDNMLKDRVR